MEERQINKWLRRQYSPLGWSLLGYYGISNVLVLASTMALAGQQWLMAMRTGNWERWMDPSLAAGDGWGYLWSIAVGALVLYAWKGSDFWRRNVLVRREKLSGFSFFCLVCLCAGVQFLNGLWIGLLEWVLSWFDLSVLSTLEMASGASDTLSMFLYASLVGPIWEELIFRGWILESLRPHGRRFAIVASAVLFGAFHGNLLQGPFAFVLGLVLGYVAMEHGIWWSIGLHVFNNLVLADLLTRLTAPLPPILADGLVGLLLLGCALASAAILLCSRQRIKAYRQSSWIDRRCLGCFFTNSGVLLFLGLMAVSAVSMLFL